jgi:hypothetical protein
MSVAVKDFIICPDAAGDITIWVNYLDGGHANLTFPAAAYQGLSDALFAASSEGKSSVLVGPIWNAVSVKRG